MSKILVVLCAVFAVSLAYLERNILEPIPEKFAGQEGCYISSMDRVIPFSETAVSGGAGKPCAEYRCYKDQVVTAGCGKIAVPDDCKIVTDETKMYPDCCPTPQCNKS